MTRLFATKSPVQNLFGFPVEFDLRMPPDEISFVAENREVYRIVGVTLTELPADPNKEPS